MVDILQLTMEELERRNALKREVYAPYYVCSYAMHCFNIMNKSRQIYWEGGEIPNLRLHIIFVAPPGYMKSYYLRQMGGGEHAILNTYNETSGNGIQMVYKQNLNEAGLVGTFIHSGNRVERQIGAAEEYSNGFLLIDEFKGITDALNASYNSQMDTQLLAALDHGHISKQMAAGTIDFDTNFTMWGGVQPARYELAGGMGRRMLFLLNIPDKELKEQLRDSIYHSKNVRSDNTNIMKLHHKIDEWRKSLDIVESIEYAESTLHMYHEFDVEPYDTSYFDRLILGYHLARFGPDKHMELDVHDKELKHILYQEMDWRSKITMGPDLIQMQELIKSYGVRAGNMIAISRQKFYKICSGISLSVPAVQKRIDEMERFGMITLDGRGSIITMEIEGDDYV